MEQEPLIIVDANGDEHEFPAGMDPKRAGAIVKQRTAPPAPVGTQPHSETPGIGESLSDTPGYNGPDTFMGGAWQSIKDQGKQLLNHLNPMLETAAKPQDIGDMLNLVIPEMGGALGATAHTAAGPIESVGRSMEKVGGSRLARKLEWAGPASIMSGDPGTILKGAAVAAVPSAVRATGRGVQKVGGALRKAEPVAEEAITNPLWTNKEAFANVGDDLESTMTRMAEEPESVVNYTPEPVAASPADESAEAVADAMRNGQLPLGKPRVQSWKSGHGPSDEMIGQLRDAEGSKSAASRLAIPVSQVKERAPRMNPRALPPEARDRITSAMQNMTPEEQLKYAASASSEMTEAFIRQQIGR